MFGLTGGLTIYLCSRPTDMRKAYDGLSGEIRHFMGLNPLSGSLFVFLNKPRNRMKILVWDRHGFWLLCKRLEAGRFEMPKLSEGSAPSASLTYEQLLMIIDGIDLSSVRQRKRYVLPQKIAISA